MSKKRDYGQMVKMLYEANELLESTATTKRPLYSKRASSYINMGHGVSHVDELKAHSYFLKALELATLSEDSELIYMSGLNLAFCCIDLGRYEEGIEYLNQSIENVDNVPLVRQMATHIGLGKAYTQTKDFLSAEYHFNVALKMISHEETGSKYMILKSLADVYYLDHQYPKAIDFALQSIAYFKEAEALSELQSLYYTLHESHAAINKHEEAYSYQLEYTAITDSLFAAEREQELLKVGSSVCICQKGSGDFIVVTKNKNKNLFLGLFCLLLISLVTVSLLYYKKWKLEQMLKKREGTEAS